MDSSHYYLFNVLDYLKPEIHTMKIRITITGGPNSGRDYFLKPNESLIVGRGSDAGIDLENDGFVSRSHCEISHDGTNLCLTDLGSANETFVLQGKKIVAIKANSTRIIDNGTVFFVGPESQFTVTYEFENTTPPPAHPTPLSGNFSRSIEAPLSPSDRKSLASPPVESPVAPINSSPVIPSTPSPEPQFFGDSIAAPQQQASNVPNRAPLKDPTPESASSPSNVAKPIQVNTLPIKEQDSATFSQSIATQNPVPNRPQVGSVPINDPISLDFPPQKKSSIELDADNPSVPADSESNIPATTPFSDSIGPTSSIAAPGKKYVTPANTNSPQQSINTADASPPPTLTDSSTLPSGELPAEGLHLLTGSQPTNIEQLISLLAESNECVFCINPALLSNTAQPTQDDSPLPLSDNNRSSAFELDNQANSINDSATPPITDGIGVPLFDFLPESQWFQNPVLMSTAQVTPHLMDAWERDALIVFFGKEVSAIHPHLKTLLRSNLQNGSKSEAVLGICYCPVLHSILLSQKRPEIDRIFGKCISHILLPGTQENVFWNLFSLENLSLNIAQLESNH